MADHVQEPPGLARPLVDPMEQALAPAMPAAGAKGDALSRAGWSWALFEGGRTPYVILVTIYIFAPYFATVMVGDGVRGQALLARVTTIYGLVAACTAPFLGAAVDRLGPRKPLLAAVTAVMIALTCALWWARPDGSGLSVTATAWILGSIGVLFAYSEVLHNALLTLAGPPTQTARISGLGLALGNAFSVVLLVFVLWAFALPGKLHLPGLPSTPLFGLDGRAHESDRIGAPIQAAVFALTAIPLFLFGRDAAKGLGGGVSASLGQLWATVKGLKGERDMATFLASRMLYTDGMTSILIFGGVLARGVMHWNVLDMLVYGVVMSIAATLGGLLAAKTDAWFGTKRSIQLQVATVIVCEILTLGQAPDRIFYMPWHGAPLWHGPVLKTLPEVLFLGLGCINALGVCGSYASGRVMLTRLTSPEKLGAYFGIFSLSGTVTLWMGSLLIGIATLAFHSQQAGFIPIAALLILGLIGVSFVNPARARARLAASPDA